MARQKEDNEVLIWLSCLEKPRSILQINQQWGINSSVLYKGNLANNLISKKLLVVDRVESKNVYYKSIFDGFKDELRKKPLSSIDKIFLKDWNIFKVELESHLMRDVFYNIEALQALLFNNTDIAKERGYLSILAIMYMKLKLDNYAACHSSKYHDAFTHEDLEEQLCVLVNYSAPWIDWQTYFELVEITPNHLKFQSDEHIKTKYCQEYVWKRRTNRYAEHPEDSI